MHLLTPITLLTLSAGALSLPTTTNTTTTPSPHLEPRGTYGWISTYAPSDTHCKGGYDVRSRPKLTGNCMIWEPSTGNIGLNFGTYPYTFAQVRLFSDLRCMNQVGVILPDAGRNLGWTTKANHGANVCWNYGGTVLSVRADGIGSQEP